MSDALASIDFDFSLKGKRVAVTGGAFGVGAAIGSAFVAKGAGPRYFWPPTAPI